VPNLYNVEDMEQINAICRRDCMAKRIAPTRINVFAQVCENMCVRVSRRTAEDVLPFVRVVFLHSICCGSDDTCMLWCACRRLAMASEIVCACFRRL
jgi:hypothetical protein